MPNITTPFVGTDGATRANFNLKIADMNAHGNDLDNPHAVTSEQTGAVPNTRKVNNKVLSADITLTPTDIGLGSVNNTADANKSVNYATNSGYANTAGSAKNPKALTVFVGNGQTSTLDYDGSSTRTISIPRITLSTTAVPSYTLAVGELYFSPN